jgi:succinate-semialdehyde dehydrogenase/glutarate-semialdehyde dehydrogenase
MTLEDTRRAIDSAYEAFSSYKAQTPQSRQDILNKLTRLFEENVDDLARLIVWENGKSWTDALAEAKYAASYIGWFAGEAVRFHGQTIPCSLPGTRNFTIKHPIGVCALLVPYVSGSSQYKE